jgi:hypothetical protein
MTQSKGFWTMMETIERYVDEALEVKGLVKGGCEQRNPHIFEGEHITITRRDDGTYHPNFRPIHTGPGFSVERYAAGVANELLWALGGLVEN